MSNTMTMERIAEAQGAPVYDSDGDKIGAVEEIFYDVQSNEPKWIGIGTGFFGTKRVLVPLESAQLGDDGLRVPYAKDHVKGAPDIDDDQISETTEQELYAYYELGGQTSGKSSSGRKEGADEVTRSEEELRVGKRTVDACGVRLRKWVETEDVAVDVELKREAARVTREPIDEPVDAELGEEEIEVSLRAEEPVAEKQVIAKERVAVEKDVETDTTTVTDEVRKERVDVEGNADER